jgi:type VI secretion system Hcp family effector
MPILTQAIIACTLALASASPARTDLEIWMTVVGVKGPFTGEKVREGDPNGIKLLSVVLDLAPDSTSTNSQLCGKSAHKPVLVTKLVDAASGQLLEAMESGEPLKVTVEILQTSAEQPRVVRRVVTLTNATVLAIHDGIDVKNQPSNGVGFEQIAFAYDTVEIEDDGVKVFASGF